jgi:hypothetical protein
MTTVLRGIKADISSDITFADALKQYKATGNNTLVVGTFPQTTAYQLSRTHFGAVEESRYRVLAVTNPNQDAIEQRFPSELSAVNQHERTSVTTYSTTARGGATAAQSSRCSLSGPQIDSENGADLDVFTQALFEEIDSLHAASTGGFEPAQLRVSLDGLEPLLGMFGVDAVDSFVAELTAAIRAYDGMGQFFLSYPRSHSVIEALEQHFEIIMTVEQQPDGSYVQTWELPAYDIKTRLPLQID